MSAKNRFLNSVSGFALTAAMAGMALPALADSDSAFQTVTPGLLSNGSLLQVIAIEAESSDPINEVQVQGIVQGNTISPHLNAVAVEITGWDIEASDAFDTDGGPTAAALAVNRAIVVGAIAGTVINPDYAPGTGSTGVLVADDIQAKNATARVDTAGNDSFSLTPFNSLISAVAQNTITASGGVAGSAIDSTGVRVDGNVEAYDAWAGLDIDNYYGPNNIAAGTAKALNLVGIEGAVGGEGASDGSTGFYVAGDVYAEGALVTGDGEHDFYIPALGIYGPYGGAATVYTTGRGSLDALARNAVSISGAVTDSGGDKAVGVYVDGSVWAEGAIAEGQALSDGGQYQDSTAYAEIKAQNAVAISGVVSGATGPATGVYIGESVFAEGAVAEGQAVARYQNYYDRISGELTQADMIAQASNVVTLVGAVTGGEGTGIFVGGDVFAEGALAQAYAATAAPEYFYNSQNNGDIELNDVANATAQATNSVGISGSVGVSDSTGVQINGVVFARDAEANALANANAQFTLAGEGVPSAVTANASVSSTASNAVRIEGVVGENLVNAHGVDPAYMYAENAYANGYASADAFSSNGLGATANASSSVTAVNDLAVVGVVGAGSSLSTGASIDYDVYAQYAGATGNAFAEATQINSGTVSTSGALATATNTVSASNDILVSGALLDGVQSSTGVHIGGGVYAYDAYSYESGAFAEASVNGGGAANADAHASSQLYAGNSVVVGAGLGAGVVGSTGVYIGEGVYANYADAYSSAFAEASNLSSNGSAFAEATNAVSAGSSALVVATLGDNVVDSTGVYVQYGDVEAYDAWAHGNAHADAYLTSAIGTIGIADAYADNQIAGGNSVVINGSVGNASEGAAGVVVDNGDVEAVYANAGGSAAAHAWVVGQGDAVANANNSVIAGNSVYIAGSLGDDASGSVGVWVGEGVGAYGSFAEGNASAEAYNAGSTGGTSTATANNYVSAGNSALLLGNVGNNAQFADGYYSDGVYIGEGVSAADAFAEGSARAYAQTGTLDQEGPASATANNEIDAGNAVVIIGTVGNGAEGAGGVYVDGTNAIGVPIFGGPVFVGASATNAFAEGNASASANNNGGVGGADATAVNNVDARNAIALDGFVGANSADAVGVGIAEGLVVAAFAEAQGYSNAYANGQTASAIAEASGTISASNEIGAQGIVGDASYNAAGVYIGDSVIAGAAFAEGSFYAQASSYGGDATANVGDAEDPAAVHALNSVNFVGSVSGINGTLGGSQYNDGVFIDGSVVAIGALAEGSFGADAYRNNSTDGNAIANVFGDVDASNYVGILGYISPGSSAEGAYYGVNSTGVYIGGDVAALGAAALGEARANAQKSGNGDYGNARATASLSTSASNSILIGGDVGSYNFESYGVYIGEGVTAAGVFAEGDARATASNSGVGEEGDAQATATNDVLALNQVYIRGQVGVSNSHAEWSTGVYVGEGVTATLAIAEGSAFAEASHVGEGLGDAEATANNNVEAANIAIIGGTIGDNANNWSSGVVIGGGVTASYALAEGSAFAEASKSGPEGIAIATASDTVTARNEVQISGLVGVGNSSAAGVDPAFVNASNATATSYAGVYVNGPQGSTGTANSTATAYNYVQLGGTVAENHYDNVGVWVGGDVTAVDASASAITGVETAGSASGTGTATATALNRVNVGGIVGPEGAYSTGTYIGGNIVVGGLGIALQNFASAGAGTTITSTGAGTMQNIVSIGGSVGNDAYQSTGVYVGEGIQFGGPVQSILGGGMQGDGVASTLQVIEGMNIAQINGAVGSNSSGSHGVWIGGNVEVTNELTSNFVIIGSDATNDGTTRGVYIGGSVLTGDALNSQVASYSAGWDGVGSVTGPVVPGPLQIGDYVELAGSVFIGAEGGWNPYGVAVGGGNDTVLVRDTHFQMEVVNGFDGGSNPDIDGQDKITFSNAKIFVSNLDNFELANITNRSMVILTNPSPYTYTVRDEVNIDYNSILSFGDGGAPPPFPIANGAPVNALTLTTEMLTIGGVAGVKTVGGFDDSILKAENNGTGSYVINAENGVYNFGTITLSKVLSAARGNRPHGLFDPDITSFDEPLEQQYWAVTGSWNIDPTSGAGDYLTINGNYTAGSDIIVDAFVFKSTSPADVVEINGNVAGLTTVWVNNINTTGVGAYTGNGPNDGILLIDVNNAQDPNVVGQAFVLGNTSGWNWADPVNFPEPEMQVGAFVYTLNQGGPDNRNFYLRSQLLDQVPAYTVMTSAIQQHFYGELGTLYQRMGELRHADYGSKQNSSFFEFWGRAWGQDLQMDPKEGFDFDMKSVGFMIGGDYAIRNWIAPQTRLHLGVFGGWGKTTLDNIDGPVGHSDGKTDGYTVGIYATYHDTAKKGRGLYIDAVGKVNWLDSEYWSNTRHTRAKSDDFAWGASVEAGYGIGLGGNFILQPQGQLSYMQVDKEKFTESKTPGIPLEIERDNADSLRGRLGLQLQNTWTTSGGTQFSPYIIGNVLHEFMGDNKTTVSGTEFRNDMGGTWFNAGAGFTVDFDNVGLYGHVEYNFGGQVEGLAAGLGVKVRLGGTTPVAPAAAPAPAPAVAPKKNYIVFFDFDRSNITADAARVIDEASSAAKSGNTARVQLTGHADRSGSEQYNMALSMRRAEAVKREMVARGVPANSIFIIARGESQPLVPTADGVREPQNRRVEIML